MPLRSGFRSGWRGTGMTLISLRYRFRQPFRVSARSAFAWCTDFQPDDGLLFERRTVRSVERLGPDAVVLTDLTFPGGRRRRIRRLVRIDPEAMAWTNTHLDGPFRHSQFWYRVVADGPARSHLEFEGLKLERSRRRPSPKETARRAGAERRADSTSWRRRLAPALHADLAKDSPG